MNTFIYKGLAGHATVYSRVFNADQSLIEVLKLQKADPERFHRMVMAGAGEEYDYRDYLDHDVRLYQPNNMTNCFDIWQEELDTALAHQQAISLNKAYDLLIDAGAYIYFPANDDDDKGMLPEDSALIFAIRMRNNPDECCCKYDHCNTLKEAVEKGLSTDNICPGASNKRICHMLNERCTTDSCPSGWDDI